MNTKPTAGEFPKDDIAKKVVTAKRLYFLPDHGVSVEAESPAEAAELVKKSKKEKDGDE